MRLAKIPSPLKKSAAVLGLIPLLLVLEVAFFYKIPWWKVSWSYFEQTLPIAIVLTLLLSVGLLNGKRFMIGVLSVFAVFWVLASAYFAWSTDSAVLAMSAVGLGIFWYFYLEHLRTVLSLPFLDPGFHWYQSLPEAIPGLTADLRCGEFVQNGLRISNLSTEGAFVTARNIKWMEKNLPSTLTLHYKGKKVTCATLLISCVGRKGQRKADAEYQGLGLQFKNTNRDLLKELSDFVELLRGEGHVI
jgi:hypothetical protein